MKTRRFWTAEEQEHLKRLYPTMQTRKVAWIMKRPLCGVKGMAFKLGLHKSVEYLKSPACGRNIKGRRFSPATEFKKGQVSWNKGRKGIRVSPASEFKKGHLPVNTLHDGAIVIRVHKSGRHGKKIAERWIRLEIRVWEPLRKYVWKKHRGPIPDGMFVAFRTADTLDCRMSNLQLIDRATHMRNTHQKDEVMAMRIARVKSGRRGTHIDRKVYRLALASPDLLRLKRAELELKRTIKEGIARG